MHFWEGISQVPPGKEGGGEKRRKKKRIKFFFIGRWNDRFRSGRKKKTTMRRRKAHRPSQKENII
jgi:hypothetical protein